MKHFISIFNESVKQNWDSPAVTNFGGNTYTYAQMAENIAKYHILFSDLVANSVLQEPFKYRERELCDLCTEYF